MRVIRRDDDHSVSLALGGDVRHAGNVSRHDGPSCSHGLEHSDRESFVPGGKHGHVGCGEVLSNNRAVCDVVIVPTHVTVQRRQPRPFFRVVAVAYEEQKPPPTLVLEEALP